MATQHSKKTTMKFIEGFIEHKGQDSKWKLYWCVFRDRIFYIFNSKETLQENYIGALEINSETKFIVGDSDPKKESFKFELRTSRHLNKFKTKRYSERELWRGYITGISTGSVPQDLDLMQGQLRMIQDDIDIFHENKQIPSLPRRPSIGGGSLPSGFSNSDGSIEGIFPGIQEMAFVDNGGPFNKHKFWVDRNRTEIPSWYFSHCTRELAEKILTISSEFGNTLMRNCFTFSDTGSYTITKATGRKFAHFEVMRVQDGYKINAVNSPQTFRCLSDVMEHFVNMSGAATTKLFTTNNFKKLGLDPPPYTTKIVQFDNENGEETQNESYEIPTSVYLDGTKTLPIKNKFSSFHNFSPNNGTRAAPRDNQIRHGIESIQESSDTAGALSTLDSVIGYADDDPYRQRRQDAGRDSKRFELPLPPLLPDDPSHKIVRKTSRSQSVPAIQFLNNNQLSSILNRNVPISRDPGVVKRQQVCSDTDNPYNRKISNSRIDDPYKSQRDVAKNLDIPFDPYRRNNSNQGIPDPYRRDMDFPEPYPEDLDFPQPYPEDLDFPEPYPGDMDNESFPDLPEPPRSSQLQHIHEPDPYKHGSQHERTVNSCRRGSLPQLSTTRPSQTYQNLQTMVETVQPLECSPKSLSGQRPISGGDERQLLGDIKTKLNQLKSTGKSVTDSPIASKSDVSARAVPPPVAAKTKPIGSAEKMTSTPKLTTIVEARLPGNLLTPHHQHHHLTQHQYRNSAQHQLNNNEYYEDIDCSVAIRSNTKYFNTDDDVYDDCYCSHTVTEDSRLPSSITTHREKDDNSSSGSIKDINGNSKSGIVACATTPETKDDIKKKLEAMFAGRPAMHQPAATGLRHAKSSPSLPNFPPPNRPDSDLDEQIYEEIPQTDE